MTSAQRERKKSGNSTNTIYRPGLTLFINRPCKFLY